MNTLHRARLWAFFLLLIFGYAQALHAESSPVLEAELQPLKNAFAGDIAQVRAAISKLEWTGISDPEIFDVAAERLEANYTAQSSAAIELNSWLAKGLALSGNPKYQPLFDKVLAMKTRKRKLRGHVEIASQRLAVNQIWNPVITKDNHLAQSQAELDRLRIRNMLHANLPDLVSAGTRLVYNHHKTDVELMDEVHKILAAQYKNSTNPEHLDAMAW
ncbi:MAG TPA: hypothetical protein VL987_17915, partial [Cellvibrio sp.]|nr:hypothetical protein [Cellvibrio sp.]